VAAESAPAWGAVVIGRNEGERLKRCLETLLPRGRPVVYVDSGSTDGSVEWARAQGALVEELDLSSPFTAARARNAGFARLLAHAPDLALVQFVDGDCEVLPGWPDTAAEFLASHPAHAVACGRRRERHSDASIFNAQCDREWNTPVGDARACGGDAMFRVSAFRQTGGYRDSLIAGEEPELCVRLRAAGWRIRRLDRDMTLHDAAILHWSQWWKRTRRTGHAFAEGAALHGAPPERHWVAETRRAAAWGLLLPAAILLCLAFAPWFALLLAAAYPLQVLRLTLRNGGAFPGNLQQTLLLVLGRIPEGLGVAGFWLQRLLRKRASLIEYK
jgi:GT2 family glycosyltransferase